MESGVGGSVDVAKMDVGYSGGGSSGAGPPGGGAMDRPPPPMDREPRPYPSYREPSRGEVKPKTQPFLGLENPDKLLRVTTKMVIK